MPVAAIRTKGSGKPNFETVWASLQDTSRLIRELREEAREDRKETARQIKETERIVKENAKQIGKLGGRFGEMIEYMVVPNLINKFQELGFAFNKAYQQATIKDEKHNITAILNLTLLYSHKDTRTFGSQTLSCCSKSSLFLSYLAQSIRIRVF